MASDTASIWEGEDDASSPINLSRLGDAVSVHFGVTCRLAKIAEGGYHKVYDIYQTGAPGSTPAVSLNAVARVASPAFPRDKMISEIATMQYIAAHSSVPVPSVLAWDVDASNPVGAEYMIMEKIPGVVAADQWEELTVDIKEKVVTQVAEHLAGLFALRFDKAGSLYRKSCLDSSSSGSMPSTRSPGDAYEVGPIVSSPFYRSLDGVADYPTTDLHTPSSPSALHLQSLRGPFSRSADFLAHPLRALLFKMKKFPNETIEQLEDDDDNDESEAYDGNTMTEPQSRHQRKQGMLQRAERVLNKAIALCGKYPGDTLIYPDGPSTSESPFTLYLDDFRLVNILIDTNTGKVNGYIDFEGTTTAPLWLAATVPQWIPDPDGDTASWYGGTPEDQRRVWDAFHAAMDLCSKEWCKAEEHGRLFRLWTGSLGIGVEAWASEQVEAWVDERLAWASQEGKQGVPMPEMNE